MRSLKEMKEKGVEADLKKNPLPTNACITCPQFTNLKPGEAFALLKQIPPDQRARVTKLELDYAGLGDHEGGDLSPIKELFPKLKKLSLGIGINVEQLGKLVESFLDLRSLGLRALHAGLSSSGDGHLNRLIKAAQNGALRKLTELSLAQNMFSPDILDSLFMALPNLKKLEFEGMLIDSYFPKLISSVKNGALSRITTLNIYGEIYRLKT